MSSSEDPRMREVTSKWIQLIFVPLTGIISGTFFWNKSLKYTIVFVIVVLTLAIGAVELYDESSSSTTPQPTDTFEHKNHNMEFAEFLVTAKSLNDRSAAKIAQPDETILSVKSGADLYRINSTIIVVRVEPGSSLLENSPPTTNGNFQTSSVKELYISEQLSERWVMFFISTFRSLENLTLDMDQLCIGSLDLSQAELLKQPMIVNVKTFVMTNDILCNMSTWIYKWKFPYLENLILYNGIISITSFVSLE